MTNPNDLLERTKSTICDLERVLKSDGVTGDDVCGVATPLHDIVREMEELLGDG